MAVELAVTVVVVAVADLVVVADAALVVVVSVAPSVVEVEASSVAVAVFAGVDEVASGVEVGVSEPPPDAKETTLGPAGV